MTATAENNSFQATGIPDMPGGVLGGGDRPPAVRMYEMLYSSLVSQLLVAVADIGLADELTAGRRPVRELAAATGAHPGALYRVMRALASTGVFAEVEPEVFEHTPLSRTLCSDEQGSMRDVARYVGLPARQQAFANVSHSLRTGEPAFDHVHGKSWWEYFGEHRELATLFNRAMGTMSRRINSEVLEHYDFGGVRHLVDVGGGQGHLVSLIAQRYPDLTAVVYDLPRVVPEAREVIQGAGLEDRVRCEGGDFLERVPGGGDLYVVSWTLHDWDDADAERMLANIGRAMEPGGTLLVIDEVPPSNNSPHFGKFEDIVMLTLLRGHIRTEDELVPLFRRAGLRISEIRSTPSPTSVIVAHHM
ncbi:methyltransferase [Marinactinospora thermotolerans]|uniref:Cyclopropane fatty-acyl-phospholipid synthase n=1 Tax=Marinactinospora thermotolerans DSM 45154 TaxID=1122192 RepID=A0A1T4R8V3_9ACTN|nr:methyltransferase [Marinactinospora thermotolerans]SKA12347.1 Cyclopropane fatty-acyl-phospholipid synthase [Marinactinospora thermotolerans DSM 45154]